MKELIYLACPYAHQDKIIEKRRLKQATEVTAELMKKGIYVFSPLTHNAPIARYVGRDWNFWRRYDFFMLSKCDKMIVLMLDGWKESKGVKSEIRKAKKSRIPIEYIDEDLKIPKTWYDFFNQYKIIETFKTYLNRDTVADCFATLEHKSNDEVKTIYMNRQDYKDFRRIGVVESPGQIWSAGIEFHELAPRNIILLVTGNKAVIFHYHLKED